MKPVLTMLGQRSSCTLAMVAGVTRTGSITLRTQHLCMAPAGGASQSVTQQTRCSWRIAIRMIRDRGGLGKNTIQAKSIKVRNLKMELYFLFDGYTLTHPCCYMICTSYFYLGESHLEEAAVCLSVYKCQRNLY